MEIVTITTVYGIPFSPLTTVLSALRALSIVHQAHHWQASGDSFYGDHLLFSRLYDAVNIEVDAVAEKAVGLGSVELVDPVVITSTALQMIEQVCPQQPVVPQPNDLANRSLSMESAFLILVDGVRSALQTSNELTNGLDNMLQDIADKHEGHVYLLKQRTAKFGTVLMGPPAQQGIQQVQQSDEIEI